METLRKGDTASQPSAARPPAQAEIRQMKANREAFPERFIQMGVAEQNMLSAAAGLSTVGELIPWVTTFAVFASKRALDQVSISVAYPRNNVKINGSYGGIPTRLSRTSPENVVKTAKALLED